MGRRPSRSGSAPGSDGPRRRRKRQASGGRRVRSARRSGSGSSPRRKRSSPPPPSRSRSGSGPPPRLKSRSRSRRSGSGPRRSQSGPRRSQSGPRRSRSGPPRRRGRGRGRRSPSKGRWQPSRSREGRDGHRRGGRGDNHKGPKPEGCRTIWVGWIDKKPEEDDLSDFFRDCGAVTEVRLSERHVRGYFAHVQFEDTDCVDRAMKKAGEDFHGTRVQLDFAYMDKVAGNAKAEAEAPGSRRYRPKSVKPPNGHTLWVGDVSIDASEQDLIDLFEDCGKIEMISLRVNQLRNGQFGHMKFLETEAVDKAVELAGTAVKGVPIRLDFAEDKPVAAYRVGKDRGLPETSKPEGCRTIWIGGLPSDATEETVVGMFDKCGEIREVRLDRSKRGGALFCHVEYAESSSVDRAVKMSGERINSSKIRVDFAENRQNDNRGGDRRMDPPPGYGPPGMPPMGPPGAWMGPPPMGMPPPGYFPPGYGPPPGHPGDMPPGNFMLPPRPTGAPGLDGPDGQPGPGGPPPGGRPPPPGWMGGPPPGYPHGPPPGYMPPPGDWRPPGYGGPPAFWDPWGPRGPPPPGYPGPQPGGPPPPGYPGYPDPQFGHRPPGPDGHPGGPPPGYPGPPPGPGGAPPAAGSAPEGAGAQKPRNRSRSGSVYSSYSYSYSPSPTRAPAA